MANATVRASAGINVTGASSTTSVTLPGTPQVGDPVLISLTTNDNARVLASTPSGWTLATATIGTATRIDLTKVYAASDGSAVSLSWNGTPVYSQAVVVFDGSVHSGFGTPGSVTTRGSSITTTTAAATGATAVPNLVISHEKASSHGSAPTVSPTTTTIVNQIDATASSGSVYVGSYDTAAGAASRTITYPTASSNGAAYQMPLTAARRRAPLVVRQAVNRAAVM